MKDRGLNKDAKKGLLGRLWGFFAGNEQIVDEVELAEESFKLNAKDVPEVSDVILPEKSPDFSAKTNSQKSCYEIGMYYGLIGDEQGIKTYISNIRTELVTSSNYLIEITGKHKDQFDALRLVTEDAKKNLFDLIEGIEELKETTSEKVRDAIAAALIVGLDENAKIDIVNKIAGANRPIISKLQEELGNYSRQISTLIEQLRKTDLENLSIEAQKELGKSIIAKNEDIFNLQKGYAYGYSVKKNFS